MNKKKKPKFKRSNYGLPHCKRVKEGWKAPKSTENKKKQKRKAFGKVPSIGYGADRRYKHLHPSGLHEVLVTSASQVSEKLKGKAIRMASKLGKRSRAVVRTKAKKLGIRVLN